MADQNPTPRWIVLASLYVGLAVYLLEAAPTGQAAPPATSADFYVAPNGNDAWSGRLPAPTSDGSDGPFATLARARDAIGALTAGDKTARPRRVLIRGGTYRLDEPLQFTPEDSGTPTAPITYEAYPGEKPILSGGTSISGWSQDKGGLWTTRVADVEGGSWYFHQLFVDGQRRQRARIPNAGTFRVAEPLRPLDNRTAARRDPSTKIGFRFRDGELQPWDSLDDAMLVVYHSWTTSRHHIASLDLDTHTVRFTAPSGWPIGYWETQQRYYVENVREGLDAAGQWYLQRASGRLTYYPLPDEEVDQCEIIAPRLRQLLLLSGKPESARWVHDLKFVGLSFQHTDWNVDRNASCDGQAAAFLDSAAIHARGARRCVFQNCEVAHVGDYAIWLDRGCQKNRIVQCHLHDLGAGGVRLGETTLPAEEAVRAESNEVFNCFIHDGGNVFHAGVGVWIGKSSHNTVHHNEISDLFYTGISVGWSWGYAASSAHHNRIEYNHIHDIGQYQLSDMGGIYTLGIAPGTQLRFNLIHDVFSYSYGGWGIYPDEGSSDLLIENNVVYRTKTGGFHQHYGRENVVRNNVFALAAEGQLQRTRAEPHRSFVFERNIVFYDQGPLLTGRWDDGQYVLDSNIYWNASGQEVVFPGQRTLSQWRETGQDLHSLIADPLLNNPHQGDFQIKPGSPALQIGFQPIDLSKVGPVGDPKWDGNQ